MSRCDNTSVGVLVADRAGRYLMFRRVKPPIGVAPVAGHIDQHGSDGAAARAEVAEEVGLTVEHLDVVWEGWHNNRCRREPGPRGVGHQWTVYRAAYPTQVRGALRPDPREAAEPHWHTKAQLLALTFRTLRHFAANWPIGHLQHIEWAAFPGLEPVWGLILADLGVLRLSGDERALLASAVRDPSGLLA